ncbi:exodeoxyribonuclease VII small subunit [Parvibaculum sp.]|jgi:exodeoxyribonuclease VII small subunit|uniref:exodeoxyribonuclease VII small subunit n=1 Tax=Parvibaculum sp. TaxID=2024848 RepID=UPI000C954098|nr:exodeoxyribonuclease VII small subunit [Parvibaculum sp.]MAB13471.1 exodeoxyribonuclease VII small subunit [Parvibaculum sp.]
MAAAKSDVQKEIEKLSFEEALAQLEKIVASLESGDVELERSIDLYERGNALKAHCEARLKAAEAKVEKIRLSENGDPAGTEPLDVE